MQPKVGTKFLHRNWLDAAGRPMVYEVSAVRDGVIFIRAEGEKKAKEHTTPERWDKVCKEVVEARQ